MKNRIRPWLSKMPPLVQQAVVIRARAAAAAGVFLMKQEEDPDVFVETFRFHCPSGCHRYEATGLFILNPETGPIELIRLETRQL